MKNTQTGTTLSSGLLCVCVFSLTSQESSEAVILGTHCLPFLWFVLIALSIPRIAFPRSHSSVSSGFRGNPNRLMCPSRLCVWCATCGAHVGVSTLIPTLLFSAHLSAADVAQACQNVSPLLREKVSKQHISRAEKWWTDFAIQFGYEGDEPNFLVLMTLLISFLNLPSQIFFFLCLNAFFWQSYNNYPFCTF